MPQALNRYLLTNKHGMQVSVCDYGARLLSVLVPTKAGKLVETTLNHSEDDAILSDESYMGCTAGRVCNRISGAHFEIDGEHFSVSANEGENTLHGGHIGFDKRFWQSNGVQAADNSVTFLLVSEDGDQGFPGEVKARVKYQLSDSNALNIEFEAITNKPTPINLCNHAYFTLGEKNIAGLHLQINANEYLPVNKDNIPMGACVPVHNTQFDFTSLQVLGADKDNAPFDHCFKLKGSQAATLVSASNGLRLDIETDQPGLQFYSGDYLPTPRSGLCLEAQGFPDAINQAELPEDILRPDLAYQRYVSYRFSAF